MDETETTTAAATGGGLRERVSRRMLHAQVREGLAKELEKAARKKGSGFGTSAVPHLVAGVSDADIDQAAAEAHAETQAAAGDGPPLKGGPILDWLKANPEIVAQVVQILLKLLLGA
jgi:protein-disulfide isomerase-like protein with CxxC motif